MTSLRVRYLRDRVMTGLVVLGTGLVLLPLFLVLGHVVREGIGAIDLAFFTRLPRPVGESGGGVLNSIVGTFVVDTFAAVLGVAFGVGTGIFLAEYEEDRLAPVVRMVSDVLAGMPAIVMGLVAYVLVVVLMGHFSGMAGAVALGLLMIPIVIRSTEGVLGWCPGSCARRLSRWGCRGGGSPFRWWFRRLAPGS